MNWVDFFILATIAISVLIGALRGFTREALSLAGWVAAIWVTMNFSAPLQDLFVPYVESVPGRMALAIVGLFVVTLIMAGLVTYMAEALLEKSGLTGTDRAIGFAFGLLRGVAIIAVLVLAAGLTEIPSDGDWQDSLLVNFFQDAALWLRQFAPPEIAAGVHY